MVDYEETRENAILSLEQQIKQLVKDAFDKGYQCGYKDRKDEPQTEGVWNAGYKTGYDKGYKDAQKVKDSQDLAKDLVKAFGEDGTWLERQGVYTLTLAEAKQRAVDIIESVLAKDEPTTQTGTQNSNLTFKTLEYCDICDHKGCEECISNALDEHCIPSQFKKQIEDECAKEYEELGLKELKELIKADRKTEPNSSEKPNNSKVSGKPTGSERSE